MTRKTPAEIAAPRSYEVSYKRSYIPLDHNHWCLKLWGDGHWCGSNGHACHYPTEQQAHDVGRIWVATGIQPCEQEQPASAEQRRAA